MLGSVFSDSVLWIGIIFLSSNSVAFAQGDLDKKTSSSFLNSDFGFSTHKSDLLNTTDFGAELGFVLGTWAGKTKKVGMAMSQRVTTTKFTQADATATSAWTDFIFTYRWMWFYPSFSLGSCAMKSSKDGVPVFDALCVTQGFGLDVNIPAGPVVNVNLGFTNVYTREQCVTQLVLITQSEQGQSTSWGHNLSEDYLGKYSGRLSLPAL